MIVSILYNIAQIPELINDLRQNQCIEVNAKKKKKPKNFKYVFLRHLRS